MVGMGFALKSAIRYNSRKELRFCLLLFIYSEVQFYNAENLKPF